MKQLLSPITSYLSPLLMMFVALLASSCDTVLQYPEEPGVDPTRPNGSLSLSFSFDLNFDLLGEFEYDFENQASPILPKCRQSDTESHLQRYTINVYPADDKSTRLVALYRKEFTTDMDYDKPQTINLELPPGDYRIVAWADFVPSNDKSRQYYDATQFSEITLIGDNGHPGSNHFRDAFYGETTVRVKTFAETSQNAHIELKRPLARYTFISDDLADFLDKEKSRRDNVSKSIVSSLEDYSVRIVYMQYMPSVFNALTGKPCDSRLGVEFMSPITALDAGKAQLAFDYIFTNGTETSITVAMEVIHRDGSVVARMPQFDVPLRRSHQTYVIGKFLTTKSGGEIGIDTEFNGEYDIVIK